MLVVTARSGSHRAPGRGAPVRGIGLHKLLQFWPAFACREAILPKAHALILFPEARALFGLHPHAQNCLIVPSSVLETQSPAMKFATAGNMLARLAVILHTRDGLEQSSPCASNYQALACSSCKALFRYSRYLLIDKVNHACASLILPALYSARDVLGRNLSPSSLNPGHQTASSYLPREAEACDDMDRGVAIHPTV